MEKAIHVNSYTRSDGTQVKEHYRNINTQESLMPEEKEGPGPFDIEEFPQEKDGFKMSMNSGPVLEGSVIFNEGLPLPEGGDGVLGVIVSVAAGVGMMAVNAAIEMCKEAATNPAVIKSLKPQLDTTIKNIKTTQTQLENLSKKYLDKLVTTTNKQEYKSLLKTYTEQKALNETLQNTIAKIEYAHENNNYEAVLDELKNYKSNFDEVIKQNQSQRPLNKSIPKIINSSNPVPIPYMNNYFSEQDLNSDLTKAYLNKEIINQGIKLRNINNSVNDASEFWKASSHDFSQNKKYIEKNGNLVQSVSDLPSQEIQQIVTQKLQQQLGVSDALGVIFQPDSSISQAISNSAEIQEFFKKNANQLLNGQTIEKGSTNFISTSNLHNALGHADILYSYIDSNGNLCSIVFDTYDFNPNDPNWLVKMARSAQEAKIIRNFYTLSIVIIPISKWVVWL